MSNEFISFSMIVVELQRQCEEKETGVFYISTESNRSVIVMIEHGQIVYINCYNKRGQEAIDLMTTIESGKYRFDSAAAIVRRDSLPETKAILQMLAGAGSAGEELESTSTQEATSGGIPFSQEQKSILEKHLTDFIGPIAAIICEENFESTSDLSTAINLLAAEIPSSVQAVKFKDLVEAKLL